jgi:hypothetical protein
MDVRSILSHELLVGDYLGVISSMHHPEHFRRVEKLEYIDADLGRAHLKQDVFYLEAAQMGPVIAWCHGIAGPLILRRRATSTSGAMCPRTGGPRTRGTCTGASSAAGLRRCSPSLASPIRPTPGSNIGSRNSRRSGNATSRSRLPLRRHRRPARRAAVVMVTAVAPDQSSAVLMPSRGLGVASNHSDITPSRKTSEAWSALESNRVRGPSCLRVLGQRDAARLRRR